MYDNGFGYCGSSYAGKDACGHCHLLSSKSNCFLNRRRDCKCCNERHNEDSIFDCDKCGRNHEHNLFDSEKGYCDPNK